MKKAVLAVDDSRTVLNMLDLYLKDRYELFCTTSGNEALQILQKKTIDIILLDIVMPVMNGMMVLKKIREQKEYQDIPVLFLTGDAHRARVIESFQIGSQGYILKPVAKDDLLQRIEEGIGKREILIQKRLEAEKKAKEAQELLEMQREEEKRRLEAAKSTEQNTIADVGMDEIKKNLQIREIEAELKRDSLLDAFEDLGDVLENFLKRDEN